MNILLNLLPENKKLYLKERVRSRFVFSQMLMLLFFLGLYIVILTGAFFSLQYSETSFQDTTRQMELDANRKMLAESEAKFQEVNRKVDIVARLNQEHFHFTELLIKLEQKNSWGTVICSLVPQKCLSQNAYRVR